VADHRHFVIGYSFAALDVAGRWHYLVLVCLRLGHAVAFARGPRLCDKAATGQSPRVLMKVEAAVKVEPVGEFELKGISRPLAAYNVIAASSSKV
jgi:hypothetical protein